MTYFTTSDGTALFFKDWGVGRPVLFSHGWPLSADAWATHTNMIEEQVSKRRKNDFAFPAACTIHFTFAGSARSSRISTNSLSSGPRLIEVRTCSVTT